MPLTEQEKEELRLEIANCKIRCREAWATLQAIEKLAKQWFKIHDHWRTRFERADRKLAEEERLTKHGKKVKKHVNVLENLTREQLIAIAEEIDLDEEGGEEE